MSREESLSALYNALPAAFKSIKKRSKGRGTNYSYFEEYLARVGKRLIRIRKSLSLPQEEMGTILGVRLEHYKEMEYSGKISEKVLFRLFEFLAITYADIHTPESIKDVKDIFEIDNLTLKTFKEHIVFLKEELEEV